MIHILCFTFDELSSDSSKCGTIFDRELVVIC